MLGDLVSDELKREIQSRLFSLLHGLTSSSSAFPGGQPVSFARSHLMNSGLLHTTDYLVCEKSDGTRYLLYFAHPPDGPSAFLIDRNWEVRAFPGWGIFSRDHVNIQEDTLLDGELIEGSVDQFLVFDCLLVSGEPIFKKDLNTRLGKIQNHVIGPFDFMCKTLPDYTFPFKLVLKRMYKAYGIGELLKSVIPEQGHPNDGLIFTPVHEGYRAGTWPTLLKWKPPELNTVDFVIGEWINSVDAAEQYMYALMIGKHGKLQQYGYIRDKEMHKYQGQVVECRLEKPSSASQSSQWRFVRTRPDKRLPNDISVADKVIQSIIDNVTETDLLNALETIRHAWKEREARSPRPTQPSPIAKPSDQPIAKTQPTLPKLEWKSYEDFDSIEKNRKRHFDAEEDGNHKCLKEEDTNKASLLERQRDAEPSTETLNYDL